MSAADSAPYAEVIGDPIAQSKSPLIHGFWLDALGMKGAYRRAHVKPDDLAAYIAERRTDPAWRGCNVTIPHKIAVMDLVDDPGDIRGTIGAMNTIVRQRDGALIGTNTDAAGFYAPLAELDLEGAPVVLIGAGGAARAVLFALARAKVGHVTILNRSPLKAMGLLATFGLKGDVVALDVPLPPAALLVNSSSLGMTGQPPLDLDLSPLPDDAIVYDLVYAPLMTGLLRAADARGLDIVDGLDMLIGQAALAFELFFGAPPPEGRDEELRAILTA
ncbi:MULTISPECIES: shikimate dehydrogenase [Sphingopyxis]|jgi:shikimate dehydrogenase|uniref:shikimate dehydrogenase n=1 Tax=Sphingopyxis TaxID=165697 RepID=UPI0007371C2C|nr:MULTISPECIES: shikimate dehydrogenase [Sphingopyxis]KTE79009.1 shikimate dehydrogenase [Sphingopyxis sp. A083]MDX8356618.1 shikimate dehydrogenase [Sphingopyxis terrae]